MPLATIPVSPYPSVPAVAGVPALIRSAEPVLQSTILLASDVASVVRMFSGPEWGLFDKNGNALMIGDSVISVDYRQEWRVADFQVEEGGFASFDKVQVPFDVRVTFAVTGEGSLFSSLIPGAGLISLLSGSSPGASNRTTALAVLAKAAKSLDVISVITPEARYDSCNIVHYDYRREAKHGVTLISVDVWLSEIRIAGTAQFTQTDTASSTPSTTTPTRADSAAPTTDGGTVQSMTPTKVESNGLPAGATT